MATWFWSSKTIEREFVKRCIAHATKILDTVKSLRNMIESLKRGDTASARESYEKVFQSENAADDVKREILRELSRGVIHPLDREYVVRLVLTMDDIAAYAKATARRLLISMNLGYSLDHQTLDLLYQMATKLEQASELLIKALEALVSSPREALSLADSVERLEEEVDEIRMQALESIFRACREHPADWCLIAKDVVDSMENAVDRTEDSADMVRLIAVSLEH